MTVGGHAAPGTDRAAWERAMRQLRMCTRLLAAALLALGARLVLAGPTPVTAVSAVIVAALLLAALLLTHHGRSYEPRSRSSATASARSPRRDTGPDRASRSP
jgi:hypothetical protein